MPILNRVAIKESIYSKVIQHFKPHTNCLYLFYFVSHLNRFQFGKKLSIEIAIQFFFLLKQIVAVS